MNKVILVDAVNTFVIKGKGIFEEMHKLLEEFCNSRKKILDVADYVVPGHGEMFKVK